MSNSKHPRTNRQRLATQVLHDAIFASKPSATPPPELATDPEFVALYTSLLELRRFGFALASGDLTQTLAVKGNLAGALKGLQANLRHLTWQTQRVADGDYSQRVEFMGDYARAFNAMTTRLAQRETELALRNAELRQSEEFTRAILDGLAAHVCVLDEHGNIIMVNRAWREYAIANPPVSNNIAEGANYLTVCDHATGPEAALAREFAHGIRATLNGELDEFSYEYPCHSPTAKNWFLANVKRLEAPRRVVIAHENITGVKLAQEELENLALFNSSIVENMAEGIMVDDAAGKMIFLNRAAGQILGYAPSELLGQHWSMCFPPDQAPLIEEKNARRQQHESDQYEAQILRRDGTRRTVLISGSPRWDQDRFGGTIAVFTDITDLQRARDALSKSEAHYRLLADNADDVIWTMDFTGKFTYVSPSVKQLRGYTPDEVLAQTMEQAICSSSIAPVLAMFQAALQQLADGKPIAPATTLVEQPCQDGSTVWTEVIARVMYDPANRPVGILGITRNITERRKLEAVNARRTEELAMLNRISARVTASLELNQILLGLYEELRAILPVDVFYAALYDADADMLFFPVVIDRQDRHVFPFADMRRRAMHPRPGFTGHILQTRQTLYIPDTLTPDVDLPTPPMHFGGEPARAYLGVPLLLHGRAIGVLAVQSYTPHAYSTDAIRLLETIAASVAFAIDHARLYETAQSRAREAETLRQAGAIVTASLKQEDAIVRILEQLENVVPYASGSVQLVDGDTFVVVGGRGFADLNAVLGMRFPLDAATPVQNIVRRHQPAISNNAPADFPLFREPAFRYVKSWMGIPLLIHDQLLGIMTLDGNQANQFTPDHARLASAFADHVAIALENARLFEETQRLSITDTLTGLYSRRHLYELATREIERARRYDLPVAIVMFDLDHFKQVNDQYGHAAGDKALEQVGALLRANLRGMDVAGRYGGEEFTVILPGTALGNDADTSTAPAENDARWVAERLRQQIAALTVKTERGAFSVTASLGVADLASVNLTANDPRSSKQILEAMLACADTALYLAKHRGRNRVQVFSPAINQNPQGL